MNTVPLHSWNVSPPEAIKIQQDLRKKVSFKFPGKEIRLVAGVDVGFPNPETAQAAVVVLNFPSLSLVDQALAKVPVEFPYIPGLLAFREGPAVLKAFSQLKTEPDLIIFDAQGWAHPRRMGLATHLGVILGKPSIGCAKSKLCGAYKIPGSGVGARSNLTDNGEVIGAVVRSKKSTAPLFISVGHQMDLEAAVRLVLSFCRGNRLPEPTRLAHELVSGRRLNTGAQAAAPSGQQPLF